MSHPSIPDTGEARAAKSGVCDLCGQEMILTPDDCWHPYHVARACPPETTESGFSQPQWGRPGRPGREHWRPSDA